ncbi:hypothetical protein ACFL6S_36445 [Candidatus Poribacteria bacterium]
MEKHPELDIEKVNADGIFNSQPCRDKIHEILGEDVELFSSVNARRKKDIENPARGIAKIMACRIQDEEVMKMEEGLRRSPPQKGEFAGKVTFFVVLTVKV